MATYPNFHSNDQLVMSASSLGLPYLKSSKDESSTDESSQGDGNYYGKHAHSDRFAPLAVIHPTPVVAYHVCSLDQPHQSKWGSESKSLDTSDDADAEILINIVRAPEPAAESKRAATAPKKKLNKGWSVKMRKFLAPKKLTRCRTPSRVEAPECCTISLEPSPGTTATLTPTTPYDCVDEYRPTSSELDPSVFQMELPKKREVLVHSKICAMMGAYTSIHCDFNFAMLSGVSRSTLQEECDGSTTEDLAGTCHRDVVKQLLECANDLVVEGFFREYAEGVDGGDSDRVEACVFSSESLRQIIICFTGSTANQARPLGRTKQFGKLVPIVLRNDDKVPIMQAFHASYFGTALERAVFTLLGNLVARKPFFDVAMTGHSFGAALATIASVRYATSNSQIRVSCHAFGSSKIGGEEWRRAVHSVPNLRIYRIENGLDPHVSLPSEREWAHCGHVIKMVDKRFGVSFSARRFDRGDSAIANRSRQSKARGKADREIQSYVDCLSRSGVEWVEDFSDLKGDGVSGADNERRTIA